MIFRPLDAVITGYAYENATAALGVLEEGRQTKRWISTEMLCTLDTLIKVVLFSDRIFFGGCAGETEGRVVPRDPEFGASARARELFQKDGLFHPIDHFHGDKEQAMAAVAATLKPVESFGDASFVLTADWKARQLQIHQEMLTMDAFFIEYSIEHGGLPRFKPVFPGEHLYLGIRQQRVPSPMYTHSIADLAGRRIRMLVRNKMKGLNDLVSLGVLPIPELPPIFVARTVYDASRTSFLSRVLQGQAKGSNIVRTLLEMRNSKGMVRFRQWMSDCIELATTTDVAKLERFSKTSEMLNNLTLEDDITKEEFVKGALNVVKAVPHGDVLAILKEVVSPVTKYIAGFPVGVLRGFGGRKGESIHVEQFLKRTFSDKFTAMEMDYISTLLELPDNVADWKREDVTFDAHAGRIDSNAPNLSRPCFIQSAKVQHLANAKASFAELLKEAVPFAEVDQQK
ncbi:hypothetical protein [Dyella subtropica]|uniref:hypothetical protein n=1 Tax=Dyella subtropica TaxID=2992127 RepID=UPI00225949DB|nr:hypothetical protein [Dyella subtropica]